MKKRADINAHYCGSPGLRWLVRCVTVVAALSALLVGSSVRNSGRSAAQNSQPKEERTLVCVVSVINPENQQASMDAVALIENGKLIQPYPEYNEAEQRKFADLYFSPGKKYRITFGGGEVGSATVKGSDMGCNNIHATALVERKGEIPSFRSSLATNSDSLGRKLSARRAATAVEHQALLRLASEIYRARGSTLAWRKRVVNYNLTATDLDGDGEFELIGSFIAAKGRARRDLFLIAKPAGTFRLPMSPQLWPLFKPALVHFQTYSLPPEGFDSAVTFVDQLDLDGDGVGEVFVHQNGFDAYGYSIFKRTNGRWRQIYTTTGDAC